MSTIRLGSNIAALRTQRALASSTASLNRSMERLSSGLRINRASDDAAGLAVSSLLNADSRVFGRGVLNINDGLSALNVAEGALQQASSITIRLRELAMQAANGTLTLTQRRALDKEADQLVEEYNRLSRTTTFNGRLLLAPQEEMSIQAGYSGSNINFTLSREFSRATGTGNFTTTTAATGSYGYTDLFDVNKDGKLDMLSTYNGGMRVRLGAGDGTFGAETVYSPGLGTIQGSVIGDFNGDGNLDFLISSPGFDQYARYMGNGNGGFALAQTGNGIAFGGGNAAATVMDLNRDGRDDLIYLSGSNLVTRYGQSDGSFSSASTQALGLTPGFMHQLVKGDFTGDGNVDLLLTHGNSGAVYLLKNQGNNTFSSPTTVLNIGSFNWIRGAAAADFNGDGLLDFISGSNQDANLRVSLNQGNGTFATAQTISGQAGYGTLSVGDMNGDGIADAVIHDSVNGGPMNVYLGAGDGTLRSPTSTSMSDSVLNIAIGDLNGDGVNDLVGASQGTNNLINILLQSADRSSTLPALNLHSRETAYAALAVIEAAQQRVSRELGVIGAAQSRLTTAWQVLQNQQTEYLGAASRITDADISEESSQVARQRILQQAGAAILSAANQLPALALSLLKPK